MRLDQKKPIPPPRDITANFADAIHLDHHSFCLAITRHVADRNTAVLMQVRGHDTDRGFDAVIAGLNSAEVLERDYQTDHSMATHPEETDVVEEDHARGAIGFMRRNEHCANEHIGTTRFIHDGGAEAVMFLAEDVELSGDWPSAEIRAALDHDASWLAAGVRVDDVHFLHRLPFFFGMAGRFSIPVWMIFKMRFRSSPVSGRRGGRTHSLPRPHSWTASLMY